MKPRLSRYETVGGVRRLRVRGLQSTSCTLSTSPRSTRLLASSPLRRTRSKVCLVHFGPVTEPVRSALASWYPGASVGPGDDPGGVVSVLSRYFGGDLASLDEIEVELHGTPFQQRVWNALRTVVAGTTTSYAELAGRVGAPSAVRAVGAANGAEPGGGRPPVPPHHRQQRQPHRLRRRSREEALAAQPRGRQPDAVLGARP